MTQGKKKKSFEIFHLMYRLFFIYKKVWMFTIGTWSLLQYNGEIWSSDTKQTLSSYKYLEKGDLELCSKLGIK